MCIGDGQSQFENDDPLHHAIPKKCSSELDVSNSKPGYADFVPLVADFSSYIRTCIT